MRIFPRSCPWSFFKHEITLRKRKGHGNINGCNVYAPGFAGWRIVPACSTYLSTKPAPQNWAVSQCKCVFFLCNLQKFVPIGSQLTALQNSAWINTNVRHPYPPYTSIPALFIPNTLSRLGKVSGECRYSRCSLHSLWAHLSSCCSSGSCGYHSSTP